MTINPALFSSNSDEWETPPDLFEALHREFQFTLDLAASHQNHKLPRYCTKERDGTVPGDGLTVPVRRERIWLNPPYSQAARWIYRARTSVDEGADVAVVLIPSRTDTAYWHEDVLPYAAELRFIRGRLSFVGAPNSAPFPSVIVVYNRAAWERQDCMPIVATLDVRRRG